MSIQAAEVTILIFLLGVAFYMGKHSQRIDDMDKWRDAFEHKLEVRLKKFEDNVFGKLRELQSVVKELK